MDAAKRRQFGFWDLALYATAMTLSLRWLASAAAAGPSSLLIWVVAALLFLGPLAIATAELTSRIDGEGAVYAWTRETLGPFAGFICAWLYWTCNLPFFSGLFLFVANVLATAGGPGAAQSIHEPAVFLSASIALTGAVAAMHAAGLGVGKWLPSFGAISTFVVLAVLLVCAGALVAADNVATDFSDVSAYAPPFNADGAILWATMVFAFGGAEGVAVMRNEVAGGMKTIARALLVVGILLALAYVLGSAAMLTILRPEEATRLGGIPDALSASLGHLGLESLAPAALVLLALSLMGSLSAWFGVAARLPFAVGVSEGLPNAFAYRDPRTGAPTVSIFVQAGLVIVLLVLSQAGETLESAYDFLVSMSVLSYTLPFLFLFAAYWRVQDKPAPDGAWIAPGTAATRRAIALVGMVTALTAIACSLTPSPDAPDPIIAVAKLFGASAVLIASGVAVYLMSRRRAVR